MGALSRTARMCTMSSYSREAGQPMSTEHKRPLLAFVAVFVVALLVVAGAARSDALRQLVQQRTVDIGNSERAFQLKQGTARKLSFHKYIYIISYSRTLN